MKKLCVVLALAMFFCTFASCSSNPVSSNQSGADITVNESSNIETSTEKTFTLPYFVSDSLNPYSATQSANFYLGSLLYDSLYLLDNSFNLVACIAESYSVNGQEIKVKIRTDAKFSDGTAVTLTDVSKSLSAAISSANYSARLSNVASHLIKDNELVIKLKKTDINFIKNLIFPITKAGSKQSGALGSGRFALSQDGSNELVKNKYSVRKTPSIESIKLLEIHKYSTLSHMIKIGSVNFAYADRVDLTTAAIKTAPVLTNNLVYLGVNSANAYLNNKDFRKAVSLCVDRKKILADAFAGLGNATAMPFNPLASTFKSENYKIDLTNLSAAKELFTVSGLTNKDADGFFTATENERVSLRLAVNSDNAARVRTAQYIKRDLEAQGIAVEIISESTEAYKTRITNKDYDLFLGEVKLTPDNSIETLLSSQTLNACDDLGETLASYNSYISGTIALDDFLRSFDLNTAFIPLLYKNNMSVCSGTLSGNSATTEYDVFGCMDKWKF